MTLGLSKFQVLGISSILLMGATATRFFRWLLNRLQSLGLRGENFIEIELKLLPMR